MNRRILTVVLVFAIAFGTLVPRFVCAQNLVVFTASSSTIKVVNNSYFLLALAANPTTGYSLSVKGFSRPGITQVVGSAFIPPTSGLMGAGGTYVYILKAIGPGTTTLTLTYARPFERGSGTPRTFQITVTP